MNQSEGFCDSNLRPFNQRLRSFAMTRRSSLRFSLLEISERIAKTGADGVRLREGKPINKSLMILGNVINKLSDSAKLSFILRNRKELSSLQAEPSESPTVLK